MQIYRRLSLLTMLQFLSGTSQGPSSHPPATPRQSHVWPCIRRLPKGPVIIEPLEINTVTSRTLDITLLQRGDLAASVHLVTPPHSLQQPRS